jgi:transposase-like protein
MTQEKPSKKPKKVPSIKLPTELSSVLSQTLSNLKGQEQITELMHALMKTVIETAVNGELTEHLGYEKHATNGYGSGNSRNGYSSKTLKGDTGELEIQVPRDRNGSFEPRFVEKHQTRLPHFDKQILACYARGMSTRDIADTFEEMYGASISHNVIAQVTEAVWDQVIAWQNRRLDEVYPILYMDCLHVKVHQEKRVINKAIYLALGINMQGKKELLGMWISENEGAKFWLSVESVIKIV